MMKTGIKLWDYRAVEQQIIDNTLSERTVVAYILVSTIAVMAMMEIGVGALDPLGKVINIAAFSVLTYVGFRHIYRINMAGDGVDFARRIMCIGLPLSIQLIVYFFLAMIAFGFVFGIIAAIFGISESTVQYILSHEGLLLIYGAIMTYFYYTMLGESFRRVSTKETDNTSEDKEGSSE